MLTLDAIRNVQFNRGRGYRADEVDEFIDECIETMEALQRETEVLNQKIKVLADKVTEYRAEEDNIRAALISAQRTGDVVLREANEKAEKIVAEANEKARRIREDAEGAIGDEQHELKRIKKEVASFKARMLGLYKEHLSLINVLPEEKEELPAEQPAPVAETVVAPVEELPVEQPVVEEAPAPIEQTVVPEEETVVVPPEIVSESVEVEETAEMKPVSRFANLKFGANYNIADDDDEEDTGKRAHNPFRKKK